MNHNEFFGARPLRFFDKGWDNFLGFIIDRNANFDGTPAMYYLAILMATHANCRDLRDMYNLIENSFNPKRFYSENNPKTTEYSHRFTIEFDPTVTSIHLAKLHLRQFQKTLVDVFSHILFAIYCHEFDINSGIFDALPPFLAK
jgi:hypothetical protein